MHRFFYYNKPVPDISSVQLVNIISRKITWYILQSLVKKIKNNSSQTLD